MYNIPTLIQIMAWHRSGDKPLSEPLMVSLPTHIYVTRPNELKRDHAWLINFHSKTLLIKYNIDNLRMRLYNFNNLWLMLPKAQ